MPRRRLALAAFLLLTAVPAAAEEWLFLTDGRVGRGRAGGDPVAVTFPDGRTEKVPAGRIRKRLALAEADRAVDSAVADLARRRHMETQGKRLEELQAAAVPRLAHHLKDPRRRHRLVALCALHHVWSPAARGPVAAALADADPEVRELAAGALARRLPPEELSRLLGPLVEDRNVSVAASVLASLELRAPDRRRMKKALARPGLHGVAARFLPRYESPELTPATLEMLKSPGEEVRHAAAAALAYQDAGTEQVRRRVRGLLSRDEAAARELAGEYFLWRGAPGDLPALEAALAEEKDPYARASLEAAAGFIRRRKEKPPAGEMPAPESFEPVWTYEGGPAPGGFQSQREKRLNARAGALGIPSRAEMPDYEEASKAPAAGALMPPLRDYFDDARSSYGRHMAKGHKAFSDSVHVGDDVAWHRDGRTVVAVGDGVVRRAGCSHTWGWMVIVEHRLPGGARFCSLYAHLSPFVCARPGEVVRRGQKIGSVGRAYTWENGGYGAHLHFGVHRGAFLREYPVGTEVPCTLGGRTFKGRVVETGSRFARVQAEHQGRKFRFALRRRPLWICGYISPADFKAGKHGWADPQAFIRSRMKK